MFGYACKKLKDISNLAPSMELSMQHLFVIGWVDCKNCLFLVVNNVCPIKQIPGEANK